MKNKLFAFAFHLAISAVVVSIVIGTIIAIWYPSPFFYTQGLFKILIVLTSVDLVLGPLLTFIVFKPAKKGLKFDFAVIALIQFSALFYGIYQTYVSRPVYVVYSGDRFDVVSQNEFIETYLKKIPNDSPYLKFSITGPKWVGAVIPKNANRYEKEEIEFSTTFGGGLRIMPKYYVSFDQVKADAISSGKSANEINFSEILSKSNMKKTKSKNEQISIKELEAVQKWLTQLNVPIEKIVLVPLKGFQNYAIVALHAETGVVLGTLSRDPWWYE